MSQNQIDILQRALLREKAARKQAEKILEEKSLELYNSNKNLERLNVDLETLLTKTDSQLQGVFENIIDAYVIMDLQGNILKMNNAALHLLGFKDDKVDYNLINMVDPKDYNKVSESFNSLLNKGSITDFEIDITTNKKQKKISNKNTFICHNIYNLSTYDLQKRPAAEKLSVLHVALRSGISSALSLNGSIYRGSKGLAGEIGLSLFGNNEILQDAAGLHALQQRLPNLPDAFWAGDAEIINAELHNPKTRETLQQALELLSTALDNVTTFLNPAENLIYSSLVPS